MNRFFSIVILGLSASLLTVSCNNNKANDATAEPKQTENEKSVESQGDKASVSGVNIAYYNQDSIATRFRFYREIDSILREKELNFQKELEAKYRSYQAYEAGIQKKMENNEITGYQIEEIQQTAMQKQQSIQQFEQQRGAALQKESLKYQTALMNKIAEAGKEFSSSREIDMLLFYQKGGQITYINNAMNVTDDFINYLNKREDDLMSGFEDEVDALEDKDLK